MDPDQPEEGVREKFKVLAVEGGGGLKVDAEVPLEIRGIDELEGKLFGVVSESILNDRAEEGHIEIEVPIFHENDIVEVLGGLVEANNHDEVEGVVGELVKDDFYVLGSKWNTSSLQDVGAVGLLMVKPGEDSEFHDALVGIPKRGFFMTSPFVV